jgi:pimeloyl-ACP methyl ester carboxylesterase
VLWTQALAPQLAPELEIVGVAAAAPATELDLLFTKQWDTVVGSLIGAEVAVAWPVAYPAARPGPVVSDDLDAAAVAEKCIERGLIDLELRSVFGQQMFRVDPMTVPAWRAAAAANTPAPPASTVPTLVIQGLKDPVVLPRTTATFVQRACAAGSDLTALWVGDLGHMTAGLAGAPLTFTWLQDRFDGGTPSSTCGTAPPVAPLPAPRFVT